MEPSTVLFLAANPVQGQPLQLGEECRAIERKMDGAQFRDRIRLVSQWAARPCDLLEALTDYAPSVLHFSGHGAGHQGLYFQSDDGSPVRVSSEALAEAMRAEGGNVKLAVLNACFSEVQAKVLITHIPCVIGMPDLIGDKAGIIYAAYIYRALASGKSVAKAHHHGIAALALHRSHEQTRDIEPAALPRSESRAPSPMLLTRSGTDADHIYIVRRAEGSALQKRVDRGQQKAVCVLTIKATLREFDEHVIARVRAELRRLSSDLALEIIDIDEGSIRLTLSLSSEAAKALLDKRADGELPEICGFKVSSLELQKATELEVVADVAAERVSTGRLSATTRTADGLSLPLVIESDRSDKRAATSLRKATPATGSDPDSDVLELIAVSDFKGALKILMQRHGAAVYRYCRTALHDLDLADDVHQQVFITAFRDLPKSKFASRTTLLTWLFGIAQYRVADAMKRRRQARQYLENDNTDQLDSPAGPREPLDDPQLRAALVSCINKLDERIRTVLLLRYQHGYSYGEMAKILHEDPGTLKASVARALPLLRTYIEAQLSETDQ